MGLESAMQSAPSPANPFALMIDPQAIFDQIERSERLERLQRRVCRPLDKPLLPLEAGAAAETADEAADDPTVDSANADEAGIGNSES
jgi:hypothetical protein